MSSLLYYSLCLVVWFTRRPFRLRVMPSHGKSRS